MIIGPLDMLKLGVGAFMGAALVAAPAYQKGRSVAEADVKTASLEKTIELITSREMTNEEITHSDAAVLCAHFGLRDNAAGECVRRVEQAHADAGDGSGYHTGR